MARCWVVCESRRLSRQRHHTSWQGHHPKLARAAHTPAPVSFTRRCKSSAAAHLPALTPASPSVRPSVRPRHHKPLPSRGRLPQLPGGRQETRDRRVDGQRAAMAPVLAFTERSQLSGASAVPYTSPVIHHTPEERLLHTSLLQASPHSFSYIMHCLHTQRKPLYG